MRTRPERSRLEVRQQAGVLLGLLGDAVDGRALACLDLAERDAFRTARRDCGVDGIAVRARLGVTEHLVEPRLDPG